MDEATRKRIDIEEKRVRAAKVLGIAYNDRNPVVVPDAPGLPDYQSVLIPNLSAKHRTDIGEETIQLLVDILHFADHKNQRLDLDDVVKKASEIHAREK